MAMTILHAQNLSKQYRVGATLVDALRDVSLAVEEGEFLVVMGPSGSGKSTLLHLLGAVDQPSSGEVNLDGQRLADLSDKEATLLRRRRVGLVFQFFNLLPTLTAEENIALPLLIDGKQLRDHQVRIDQLLELVGLSERRRHMPDQLSGGEQQRVAIARAMVSEPAILLADEPTGNLDTRIGDEILELLRRACDQRGQAIVMVTHDARAASYGDRILFLRDGQVAGEMDLVPHGDSSAILQRLGELEM